MKKLVESRDETLCFLEVKSVTLVKDGIAIFPDAPTLRGTRHIHHLMEAMNEGYEAAILFVVQREDGDRFMPNNDTDPEFASALRRSQKRGVRMYAYNCRIGIAEAEIHQPVDIIL